MHQELVASMIKEALTLDAKVVVSQNQISAELNDEVIVLNLQSGIYFGLTDVAARIWSLMQQPVTCAEIAATIFEEFEMEQSQIEADVMSFIHKMKDLELVDVQQ
jgi:hypothetical protein